MAADIWRTILADMAALRTLREVDMPLVLAYCEAVYVHAEASANIHRYGVIVKGPRGPIANPLLRVQKDAAATMRQLSDVLGLNPLARIRANLMDVGTGPIAFSVLTGLERKLDAQDARAAARKAKPKGARKPRPKAATKPIAKRRAP